jgi:putative NIF3 family GTP cyclohydrolase 1 type 2
MVKEDCRLLVCHEPTFWDHSNDRPESDRRSEAKLKFAEENRLVILRNHDCWDRWPAIGIPWAWARFLGLEGEPEVVSDRGYQHRYDISPLPLDDFARQVAERCGQAGEPVVQVSGPVSSVVSKIGIGTGCGCRIETYLEMGCDCSIVCDDGSTYWAGIQKSLDLGYPVIRVNHGTSEEPGMKTMTDYINENIEDLRATLLPHGSMFRLVGNAEH